MQQLEEEFNFKGTINKDNRKIYDNIQKIRKNDPFYICVQMQSQRVEFVSLGRSDTHHFSLQVDDTYSKEPVSLCRVDLETFKLAILQFRNNMMYNMRLHDNYLEITAEIQPYSTTSTYICNIHNKVPLISMNASDTEHTMLMLNLPLNNTLYQMEFRNPLQFKLLAQQIRALKIARVQFEIIPEQSAIRFQSYYEADGNMVMKYIFNNYKIIQRSAQDREKFTYDSNEFIESVQLLDKDNPMTFLLTSNGSLLLSEQGGEIYNTKSILQRIIVHNEL